MAADEPGDDRQTHMDFSRETSLDATPVADVANTTHSGRSEGYQEPSGQASGPSQPSQDSGGQQEPTPEYTPGDMTEAQAKVMANGNEGVARKIMAMDSYLEDQQDSTLVGTLKEGSKSMLGGASGYAAGALVAGSGPVGLAAAAGAGLAAGVAGYGLTSGIDRAKPQINQVKTNVTSFGKNIVSSGSGDSGGFAGDKYDDET